MPNSSTCLGHSGDTVTVDGGGGRGGDSDSLAVFLGVWAYTSRLRRINAGFFFANLSKSEMEIPMLFWTMSVKGAPTLKSVICQYACPKPVHYHEKKTIIPTRPSVDKKWHIHQIEGTRCF